MNEIFRKKESVDLNEQRALIQATAKKFLGKNYADWVDDITQDVMFKILTKVHTFDKNRGNFESWIYSITRNLCFDLMNKKVNSIKNIKIDESFVLYFNDDAIFDYKELKKMIRIGLDRLNKIDKSILIMRFYLDLSGREIAEILNFPENQVPVRLLRAKNRLKNFIDYKLIVDL